MKLVKWLVVLAGFLLIAAAVWIIRFPGLIALGDPAASPVFQITEPSGGTLLFRAGPRGRDWTPLRRIARPVRVCVVASEDDRFYRHHGFDFVELGRSFRRNVEKGAYVRGGSTLTMQLARTLFLSGEKTLRRKTLEALLALHLELALDKPRILELYLNAADWGRGVRGIGPAARRYYGKPPSALTWGESAYLAAMLPNPHRYNTAVQPGALRKRQQRLVARLIREGRIPEDRHAEAISARPPHP